MKETPELPGIDQPPTLFAQISELLREKKLREYVYPIMIGRGKLTQAKADFQMRCLQAAIETLKRLEAGQ